MERRDLSGVLADLRVGVAEIKTTQNLQTKTLERMEARLDVAILRDEFNAYKTGTAAEREQLREQVTSLTNSHNQQKGATNAWRLVFSGALALLTLAVAVVGALRL